MKRIRVSKGEARAAKLVVPVKPEGDFDWMIRGEEKDGVFVPDFVPEDAFTFKGLRRMSLSKMLDDDVMRRYREKHFSSFAAAKRFCKANGWKAIEGY